MNKRIHLDDRDGLLLITLPNQKAFQLPNTFAFTYNIKMTLMVVNIFIGRIKISLSFLPFYENALYRI